MFGLDISHKDFFVLYIEYRFTDKWETLQCHLFFFFLEFMGNYKST